MNESRASCEPLAHKSDLCVRLIFVHSILFYYYINNFISISAVSHFRWETERCRNGGVHFLSNSNKFSQCFSMCLFFQFVFFPSSILLNELNWWNPLWKCTFPICFLSLSGSLSLSLFISLFFFFRRRSENKSNSNIK